MFKTLFLKFYSITYEYVYGEKMMLSGSKYIPHLDIVDAISESNFLPCWFEMYQALVI